MSTLWPHIPQELRDRIGTALADASMSPCAGAVLARLQRFPECAGRSRAISIVELQADWRRLGVTVWSDRWIKAAVKELIEQFNVPVGSARTEPMGYFLCCDAADRRAAVQPIRAEVFSLLKRWRTMDDESAIAAELAGQMRIAE